MGVLPRMKVLEFILHQAPMKFMSALYIISLLSVFIIVGLLVLFSSSNPKKVNESLINSLMGLAFIFFVFKYVMVVVSGTFSLQTGLPLSISDITFMIMLLWSLCHRDKVGSILYYFGMLFLILYSIFQVNVYPYFNIVYILDMLMVAFSMASFIIYIRNEKYSPKSKDIKSSILIITVVALSLYGIDYYLGSHYLYLDWFSKATPFALLNNLFVQWSVYLIIAVVLVLYGLVLALILRRKERIEAIYTVSDTYMKNYNRRV